MVPNFQKLKLALWLYQEREGLSRADLERRIGLSHQTIGRFLDGTTNRILNHEQLAKHLEERGYWPLLQDKQMLEELFPILLEQFFWSSPDYMQRRKNVLTGTYRYYQWSSRYPGYIVISQFRIMDSDNSGVLPIIEEQRTGSNPIDGLEKTEKFVGHAFYSNRELYFLMKEPITCLPKFIRIDVTNEDEKNLYSMEGYTLKGSRYQTLHYSRVYLEKVNDQEVKCQIVLPDEVDKKIQKMLNTPLKRYYRESIAFDGIDNEI